MSLGGLTERAESQGEYMGDDSGGVQEMLTDEKVCRWLETVQTPLAKLGREK